MQSNQIQAPSSRSTKDLIFDAASKGSKQPFTEIKEIGSGHKKKGINSLNLSLERNLGATPQNDVQKLSPQCGTLKALDNQISDMDKKTSSSSKIESSFSNSEKKKHEMQNQSKEKEFQKESQIKDVWQHNFVEELTIISSLVDTNEFNIISFDTEFPGILYEGKSWVNGQLKYKPHYEWITKNVNDLKLIQIGITLADEKGRTPKPVSTWQFNMQFDVGKDTHTKDSINMLIHAGLDFKKHAQIGIQHTQFANMFKTSGLIRNANLTWVAFNSSFDFAYMIKLLDDNNELPICKYEFLKKCSYYFPHFYDVKQLEISTGSLAEQANKTDIKWEGNSHQAGSDSLVTMKLFCQREIKDQFYYKRHFNNKIKDPNFDRNVIYKFDQFSNSDDEVSYTNKSRGKNNGRNRNQNNHRGYRKGHQNYDFGNKKRDYEIAARIAEQIGKTSSNYTFNDINLQNIKQNSRNQYPVGNSNEETAFYDQIELQMPNRVFTESGSSGDSLKLTKVSSGDSYSEEQKQNYFDFKTQKQFDEDVLLKYHQFNMGDPAVAEIEVHKQEELDQNQRDFQDEDRRFYAFPDQQQSPATLYDPLTNIDMVHPNFLDIEQQKTKTQQLKVPMSTNAVEFVPGRINPQHLYPTIQHDQKGKYQNVSRRVRKINNRQKSQYEQPTAAVDTKMREHQMTVQQSKPQNLQQQPLQSPIMEQNRKILEEFIANNINLLSPIDQQKLENIARVHKITKSNKMNQDKDLNSLTQTDLNSEIQKLQKFSN